MFSSVPGCMVPTVWCCCFLRCLPGDCVAGESAPNSRLSVFRCCRRRLTAGRALEPGELCTLTLGALSHELPPATPEGGAAAMGDRAAPQAGSLGLHKPLWVRHVHSKTGSSERRAWSCRRRAPSASLAGLIDAAVVAAAPRPQRAAAWTPLRAPHPAPAQSWPSTVWTFSRATSGLRRAGTVSRALAIRTGTLHARLCVHAPGCRAPLRAPARPLSPLKAIPPAI